MATVDPSWPAMLASAAPIAVGAITVHFKLFIESDGEFRKRVSLRRKELVERLAGRFASVLQHVRSMTDDDVLRGDGREEPDLVGELAQECSKVTTVLHRMEVIRFIVKAVYTTMWLLIVLGILGFFMAWLWEPSRQVVLYAGIAVVLLQAAMVYAVMQASSSLEVYEDVA